MPDAQRPPDDNRTIIMQLLNEAELKIKAAKALLVAEERQEAQKKPESIDTLGGESKIDYE